MKSLKRYGFTLRHSQFHPYRKVKPYLFGAIAGVLSACSSTPLMLPTGAKSSVKFTVPARATILASQPVTGGPAACSRYAQNFLVTLKRDGQKAEIPMNANCSIRKGELTLVSSNSVPKGEYRVSLNRKSLKDFTGEPMLYARYERADFASGNDYFPEGAASSEANQEIKGAVNYNTGDRTDWIRLKGKNTNVQITLLGNDDESDKYKVGVFWFSEAHSAPQQTGVLTPGKKKSVRVEADDIYLRVLADEFSGTSEYLISRRDSGSTKKQSIAVLDCYAISDSHAVVLLQAAEGMKVSDQIMISGKTAGGKNRPIGKCEITSIADDRANCRLDRPYPADIVEYRAEAKGTNG